MVGKMLRIPSLKSNATYFMVFALLLIGASSAQSYTSNITTCNATIDAANSTYSINHIACTSINITFAHGVSNSQLICNDTLLGPSSKVIFGGANNEDYLFNCSFSGAKIIIGNNSSADLVSPIGTDFNPILNGRNASLTVGYFLNISVFEPFGSNSVEMFGNRIGAFSYIIPLFNNTIKINNTQLQMVPSFDPFILNLINRLNKTLPFGVYGQNQSAIYENFTQRSYGNIFGYKKFMLPSYTLTENGIVNYNPYAVEYSFLGFDQLVMYSLNITKNTNLMPVYIEPIYPKFNYYIIPDNGQKNMTIRWLVAVPPQDSNWNFSSYLYRYTTTVGFIMNPLNNSIADNTSLVKLMSFPSENYSMYENGTRIFYLNYTSKIGIGLNSSIMLLPGHIPGVGSFIQDSTTPSFSYGLGFCSTAFNQTRATSIIKERGTYNMVANLFPLASYAPVLIDSPCYIGAYIKGSNITINCNNRNVSSLYYGFIINGASNVTLHGCRIFGNGIEISNSTNVNVYNTTIVPTSMSSTNGVNVYNSSNVLFYGLKISSGFSDPYSILNSSYISIVKSNLNYSSGVTTLPTSIITSNQTAQPQPQVQHLNQRLLLYASSAVILLVYIYLFFKLQYKPEKSYNIKAGRKSAK
ncbi:MAG: right-handed parallel beta-helix repeat-containing protein [Candidatus Micrarchaeia archaeon]